MRHYRSLFAALCIVLVASQPLFAWNKAGHMVSGAIAYHTLKKRNPAALAKVIDLLKEHPDYESRWTEQLEHVAKRDRDLVLFMLAARWPDDIRGNDDFDRPTHHYINLPYRPGAATAVETADSDEENIDFAYRHNLAILRSDDSDDEKAVALCWLFHLLGDVHQPLHTVALFNTTFPDGDRGGTRFYVKDPSTEKPVSLHSLWDGLILKDDTFQSVKTAASKVRSKHPAAELTELASEFAPADFDKWLKDESFELAKTKVYTHKNQELKGGKKPNSAKELPEGYSQAAKKVAERRMALAGYRLAALLEKVVE